MHFHLFTHLLVPRRLPIPVVWYFGGKKQATLQRRWQGKKGCFCFLFVSCVVLKKEKKKYNKRCKKLKGKKGVGLFLHQQLHESVHKMGHDPNVESEKDGERGGGIRETDYTCVCVSDSDCFHYNLWEKSDRKTCSHLKCHCLKINQWKKWRNLPEWWTLVFFLSFPAAMSEFPSTVTRCLTGVTGVSLMF